MKQTKLSNISSSILEIISEQRNVHSLVIKGQTQELNKFTGRLVSDSEVEEAIEQLEQNGLIEQLTTPVTFKITEEGEKYL
jgi:predicted transcriptional regulator